MNFDIPVSKILIDMRRKNINSKIKKKYSKDVFYYVQTNNVEIIYDIIKEYNWNFFQRAFKNCIFEIKWSKHNHTAIYKKSERAPTSVLLISGNMFRKNLQNKELFGVLCINNLYALQVVIEHQLIHSLIFMKLKYNETFHPTHKIVPNCSYHNTLFVNLSKNIFHHINIKKSLRF